MLASVVDVLDEIGRVEPEYAHRDRPARSGAPLSLPAGVLKWHEVWPAGDEIPAALRAEARRVVAAAAPAALAGGYGMGFGLLHHSTTGSYLFLGVWRNHQELWTSIWQRARAGAAGFEPVERPAHGPCACVWELGPIWHERQAWIRYLTSARDLAARYAWLDDGFEGLV